MSAPDMSHSKLFLDYTPLDSDASLAENKLREQIPTTPAPGAGTVDLVFRDPLDGFTS